MINDYLTAVMFTEAENIDIESILRKTDEIQDYFTPEFIDQSTSDIESFQNMMGNYWEDLIDELGTAQVMYDLWLTRNHHGAGFWEQDSPQCQLASKIALQLGGVEDVEIKIPDELF